MDYEKGIGRNPANAQSSIKGKNYLLGIGINDYLHCPKLNNAVKDIEDFSNLMINKFGFEKNNVLLLKDKNATYERISQEFDCIIDKITENDSIIIYFSGHGEIDKKADDGFWIPVDGKVENKSSYIRNSYVNKIIDNINSFHTFLIVDSCYSGSYFLGGKTRGFDSSSHDDPSRWALTSGRNKIVSDGLSGTNSPFAKELLYFLNRTTEPLPVGDLCQKIKQSLPAATNRFQIPMSDCLGVPGHKGGQFIFYPKVLPNSEQKEWENTKKHNIERDYDSFISKHPNSTYVIEAKANKEILTKIRVEKEQKERSIAETKRKQDLQREKIDIGKIFRQKIQNIKQTVLRTLEQILIFFLIFIGLLIYEGVLYWMCSLYYSFEGRSGDLIYGAVVSAFLSSVVAEIFLILNGDRSEDGGLLLGFLIIFQPFLFMILPAMYMDYQDSKRINLALNQIDNKQYIEAFESLQIPIKDNSCQNNYALSVLGDLYINGQGVTKDIKKGIELYKKSADNKCPEGQVRMGWIYQNGIGVQQDYNIALQWYELAAKENSPNSYVQLGNTYLRGLGVNPKYEEAALYFQKAAEADYKVGYYSLGYLYENGYFYLKDVNKAKELYQKADNQGYNLAKEALKRLGSK